MFSNPNNSAGAGFSSRRRSVASDRCTRDRSTVVSGANHRERCADGKILRPVRLDGRARTRSGCDGDGDMDDGPKFLCTRIMRFVRRGNRFTVVVNAGGPITEIAVTPLARRSCTAVVVLCLAYCPAYRFTFDTPLSAAYRWSPNALLSLIINT